MNFSLTIPLEPLPQPRPRFAHGRAYEPARIKSFKKAVSATASLAMAGNPPLSGELEVSMTFARRFSITSRRFGDVDNLGKAAADALTGVVWNDDSQITRLVLEKTQSPSPFLEVNVFEQPDEDAVSKE